jgi:hypothetical protein
MAEDEKAAIEPTRNGPYMVKGLKKQILQCCYADVVDQALNLIVMGPI